MASAVVCQELGFNYTYSFFKNSHFGTIPDWFLNSWNDINCIGDELSLSDCSYTEDGKCASENGIGIICSDTNEGI